jgi:mannan endo-1,4-beta-mannosidase
MKKMQLPFIIITAAVTTFYACGGKKADVTPPKGGGTTPPADTVVVVKPTTPYKSLNYLYTISGKKTVAGIHNREPNATPAVWTEKVYSVTGKYPALWSGDFLFQQDNIDNRQIMINEAIAQYQKGALVNIMWHACNPALTEPCGFDSNGVLSKLNNDQWAELTTDGSPLNKQWKLLVDEVCFYLH